jgi:dynein heavy chain 1
MDKEGLYGSLDGTTMEWTDGVFTSLLRIILANQKGEADRRHWIVFDGDVDPEWAENLNRYVNDSFPLINFTIVSHEFSTSASLMTTSC